MRKKMITIFIVGVILCVIGTAAAYHQASAANVDTRFGGKFGWYSLVGDIGEAMAIVSGLMLYYLNQPKKP